MKYSTFCRWELCEEEITLEFPAMYVEHLDKGLDHHGWLTVATKEGNIHYCPKHRAVYLEHHVS